MGHAPQVMIRRRVDGYIGAHPSRFETSGPKDGAGDRVCTCARDGRVTVGWESHCVEERGWSGREPRGRRSALGGRVCAPRRVRIVVISTLVAFAVWLVAAASASAFTAQGSAEQVYVTGLAPNAQMSLLNSNGATVSTQNADSLGGLLFRNVTPGSGYRVRVTSTGEDVGPDHRPLGRRGAVGSQHLQPVDPRQRIHVPDDARRHPAVDRRPPADQPGGRARRAVELPLSDLADTRVCRRRATRRRTRR